MLQHQAGLADYSELADYHAAVREGAQPWPADEMLQRLDAYRLRYAPGAGWRYSNVGYLWVGRVIERLAGCALEQALAQRIFLPLGVSQVRLATTQADLHDVSFGAASTYHPCWVYHGLLVGPLSTPVLRRPAPCSARRTMKARLKRRCRRGFWWRSAMKLEAPTMEEVTVDGHSVLRQPDAG
ncbi:hypothetical protein PS3A_19190 [Pseudomonas sp. 3A(2025)]